MVTIDRITCDTCVFRVLILSVKECLNVNRSCQKNIEKMPYIANVRK